MATEKEHHGAPRRATRRPPLAAIAALNRAPAVRLADQALGLASAADAIAVAAFRLSRADGSPALVRLALAELRGALAEIERASNEARQIAAAYEREVSQ